MSFMESPHVLRAIEEIEFLQDRVQEVAIIVDLSTAEGLDYRQEELKIKCEAMELNYLKQTSKGKLPL